MRITNGVRITSSRDNLRSGGRTRHRGAPPDKACYRRTLGTNNAWALKEPGLVTYDLDKVERARLDMYIYNLAVAESHPRRGIARG